MTETITEKTPSRIHTVYESNGVWNECINPLKKNENKTINEMKTEFRFGFLLGLFMWVFKPIFKKETLHSLTQFKEYCESIT